MLPSQIMANTMRDVNKLNHTKAGITDTKELDEEK